VTNAACARTVASNEVGGATSAPRGDTSALLLPPEHRESTMERSRQGTVTRKDRPMSMPALRNTFNRIVLAVMAFHAVAMPRSAAGQIAVVGSTVEEHTAAPGQTYEGTILTATPQAARIYQTDYHFFADGTSHFDAAASTPRSNAAWVKPSATSIVLPPNGEMTLGYSIAVPKIDTLRGTFWSALMVEGAPTAPPTASNKQVGLGAVVRYAVQLATHLPSSGSRKVAFQNQSQRTDSTGHRIVEVEVENIGERGYRPSMWVELYNEAGALLVRREQQRGLLYPGTSLRQRFDFDALPAGTYKAVVFADTGDDAVFATQYNLKF
jgi:hypothetical protein